MARENVQQVGVEELDTVGQAEGLGVVASEAQGVLGNINGGDVRLWKLLG